MRARHPTKRQIARIGIGMVLSLARATGRVARQFFWVTIIAGIMTQTKI